MISDRGSDAREENGRKLGVSRSLVLYARIYTSNFLPSSDGVAVPTSSGVVILSFNM